MKIKQAIVFCLLYFLATTGMQAQGPKIYYEKKGTGYVIYADNAELYPVSILMDLNITNLTFSEGLKKIFVIPPKRSRQRIGELKPQAGGFSTNFRYNYRYAMGDVTITKYDKSFVYQLPFERGKSFLLFQGYNGSSSHQNQFALDFPMPEGTEVLAARDGTIVQVIQHNTEHCPSEDCKIFNNHIIIMHSDGTYATYAHIKQNGAKAQPGDKVKQGDLIAYSGNVGWSGAPHLHFACFIGGFEKYATFETTFRTGKGDTTEILKEKSVYVRDY